MLLCYLIPSTLAFTSQKDAAAPIFPRRLENGRSMSALTSDCVNQLLSLPPILQKAFSFSILNSSKWVSFGYRPETKIQVVSNR